MTFGRDPRPGSTGAPTVEISGDPLVSKSHFAVDVQNGSVVISDLGSSNGTFLHTATGEAAVPTDEWIEIADDAEIEFGDQRARVSILGDATAAAAPVQSAADDGTATVARDEPAVPPIAPADPWGAESSDASGPAEASIECVHCQRDLPAGAKFCDVCGTATAPVATSDAAPDVPNAASVWAQDAAPEASATPPPPQFTPQPVAENPPPPASATYVAGPPPAGEPPAGPPPNSPSFVEHDAAAASSSGGAGKKIALGVGVLAILGIGAFAVTQLLGGDGGSSSGSAELVDIPGSVDEQWSESGPENLSGGAIGDDSVYSVAVVDGQTELTSFARSDGEEQWSEEVGGDGFLSTLEGVTDGVVVVQVCDDECDIYGVDAETGDELWDVAGSSVAFVDAGVLVIDNEQAELVEPASGDRIERVRFEFSLLEDGYLYTVDGEDVDVYDLDLNPVYGPYEFGNDVSDLIFDGSSLVVATDDELQFLDDDETVVKESEVDVGDLAEILYVNDSNFLVTNFDDEVFSLDPIDGDAEERWSEDGELIGVYDVDGGSVVLIRDGEDVGVFDADTGDRRFRVEAPEFDSSTTIGANALVVSVVDPDSNFEPEITSEVVAYDWETGDELWDDEFDGLIVIDRGAVASFGFEGDVTLYQ